MSTTSFLRFTGVLRPSLLALVGVGDFVFLSVIPSLARTFLLWLLDSVSNFDDAESIPEVGVLLSVCNGLFLDGVLGEDLPLLLLFLECSDLVSFEVAT